MLSKCCPGVKCKSGYAVLDVWYPQELFAAVERSSLPIQNQLEELAANKCICKEL